jgi:rSAM/selenodomain-associated transferase 2
VADGGSRDATVALARAAGARVIEAPRGRGPQMNAGARATRTAIVLFLHADCALPPGAVDDARQTLADGHGAGIFRVRYSSNHVLLRLSGAATRWETPLTSFGEGALFVQREVFESVGGYPDWPLFEDVELLRRLRRVTRIGRARGTVHASARRFQARGVWRQQLTNAVVLAAFRLGVPPQRLMRLYDGGRNQDATGFTG